MSTVFIPDFLIIIFYLSLPQTVFEILFTTGHTKIAFFAITTIHLQMQKGNLYCGWHEKCVTLLTSNH
jgi:hypothetical protein